MDIRLRPEAVLISNSKTFSHHDQYKVICMTMIKTHRLLFFVTILWVCSFMTQGECSSIEVTELYRNLYKMRAGINNWIVMVSPKGVLLCDNGPERLSEAIKSELHKLGNDNIRFIINTHWHHDHCGGNLVFGKEAIIIAHESVRQTLSEEQEVSLFGESFQAFPKDALPELTFSSSFHIDFDGEEIAMIHMPNGHTKGDVIVYFKNANILHIGDLYIAGHFPPIDYDHGGDVEQFADNLLKIIEKMPKDVRIISGHLEDGDLPALKAYHKMVISTIGIVRMAIEDGKSLEDMKRAGILDEWDAWGKHLTCEMWIETIFHCLKQKKEQHVS